MKQVGILVFPGTQCDRDTKKAFSLVGRKSQYLWYADSFDYKNFDSFVLPGGFSYGDYLRAGALAAQSPAVKSVMQATQKGYPVLGICNGFQILCETNLLPGVLAPNIHLKFIDGFVELELVNASDFWGKSKVQHTRLPIAHQEGRYLLAKDQLEELKQNQQIWLRYKKNPNGSVENIAGVFNKKKNVAALMPHPERAIADWMGSKDGLDFLQNF